MAHAQTPLGTAFTYQGRLTDGGGPASGSFDMQFKLFASLAGSDQVGATVTQTVPVAGGLFTVGLDFGASAFGANKRWLEIGVKPAGSGGGYTLLAPRQELSATPQAQYALSAGTVAGLTCADGQVAKWSGGPTGTWTCGSDVDTNSGGTVTSVATGAGLTGGPITGSGTIAIASGGITSGMIGTGQVVKSVNGLADVVTLAAAGAASLTTTGNTITINVNVEVPSGTVVLGTPQDTTLIAQGYQETADTVELWSPTRVAEGEEALETRNVPTAVWTGTHMVVWGGFDTNAPPSSGALNSGARYDPALNSWTPTSATGAPAPRYYHTAIWTGTRMIVWGGLGSDGNAVATGARYDPTTDTWAPTSGTGAPTARAHHTAVWTGAQMIVWGGFDGSAGVDTGARYDPATDAWTATTTTNAPSGRHFHTAVWTGARMVVWGGGDSLSFTNSGGRYDPGADAWTPVSSVDAPTARVQHTAVWTGTQMVVWGGVEMVFPGFTNATNTGARYDPATDVWTATSTFGAPSERGQHSAVWTGTEMVVWGGTGFSGELDNGALYNPETNAWFSMGPGSPPSVRRSHAAVWTGTEMIVWGGFSAYSMNTGGRWSATLGWRPTTVLQYAGSPSPRKGHTAVWTGTRMIVWGGTDIENTNTGGRYDPATNTWSETSRAGAPSGRTGHTAVWTGTRMIVWGGSLNNTGGRYDPVADVWESVATTNAPPGRFGHTAVWTGTLMVVWGGSDESATILDTGGRYDPATDTWSATSTAGAPEARNEHTAVWTGTRMVVWGGSVVSGLGTGGVYDPTADTWTPTTTTGAPGMRFEHSAVWTGTHMIVWGGANSFGPLRTGGRYDPLTDSWSPTALLGSPTQRRGHSAVWTGRRMVVWGGQFTNAIANGFNTGGSYDPVLNSWTGTSVVGAPTGRVDHTALWTGTHMIVWGGLEAFDDTASLTNTGGRWRPFSAYVKQ